MTTFAPVARLTKNDFAVAALIGFVLSAATFALAYSAGWMDGAPNWFEVIGATINYGATYLSIKQRRFAYILGVVASFAFAIAYFQFGLVASGVLSIYLTVTLIYGFIRWGKDTNPRPVHNLQIKWLPVYIIVTTVFYLGAAFTADALGGAFAFWDAAILVLTILAQFLLDNKVLQTWIVWTAVNIVGVTLYWNNELYFAAFQQLLFGLANIPGYILWRQSMKGENNTQIFNPNSAYLRATKNDTKTTDEIYESKGFYNKVTVEGSKND